MKRFSFTHLTIRQRLPLLICSLLLAVCLTFGWISYFGIKQAALKVGQDRLQSLTEQLSTLFTASFRGYTTATRNAASQDAIKKCILSNGKDSVAASLKDLQKLRLDTSYILVQLLDRDQHTILSSSKEGIQINAIIDSALKTIPSILPDSARIGKFYVLNDSVYYPVIATVTANLPDGPRDSVSRRGKEIIGYLIRWRIMKATAQALEQVSHLIGTDGRFYLGNKDGSLWTDMMQPVSGPPAGKENIKNVIEYSRTKNHPVIAAIRPLPGTNWLLSVELSQEKILEAAHRFRYWLILAGVVLLAAGIFAAWKMSRSITNPLKKLTSASSSMAAGNYSLPVEINRYDELGKLARAFNAMAVRVQNSQEELKKKVQQYKLLFENNPMPMWIASRSTYKILDVNKVAIRHYGYTRDEFLNLTTKDLRPAEDVQKYLAYISKESQPSDNAGIWRHKKKDGTIIIAEVIADDIIYQNEKARLILASDVTEKLKAEAELVRHRIMQQKLITEITIQAQEKERNEIGRELHDNINQVLATIKMYLKMSSENTGKREELIEKSSNNINYAIEEIRRLSKSLVAPSLGDTGLVDALEDLIEEINLSKELRVQLINEISSAKEIDKNMELMLYRIAQEQLNNIRKYAKAEKATITIKTGDDKLFFSITDNGVGFDTAKKIRGIGLKNINSRVDFYSGKMNVISAPGKGCRLEINIPI
jgi:PAS domain S-box-containing protein